jgi:hypothetical protein
MVISDISDAQAGSIAVGRVKNSLFRKELAQLSSTQLTSDMSPNNDMPQAGGLKKTQGGGELRQKQ